MSCRKDFVKFGLPLFFLLFGCQQTPGSESKAVVNASGTKGMTLLPMRRVFPIQPAKDPNSGKPAFKLAYTDASRAVLGVVHCEGSTADAGAKLNTIEQMVMGVKGKNPLERFDYLKFDGTSLKTRDGASIPAGCSVSSAKLTGGGFAELVGQNPYQSQEAFDKVQLLYLTFRGPYKPNTRQFHTHMYSFLRESFDAMISLPTSMGNVSDADRPAAETAAQGIRVANLDTLFNPCEPKASPDLAKNKLVKDHLFQKSCDANGNYIVKEGSGRDDSNYEKLFAVLMGTSGQAGDIQKANDAYIAAVGKINGKYAEIVRSSMDAKYDVAKLAAMLSDDANAMPASPNVVKPSPLISSIDGNHLKAVADLFGVSMGQAPGNVLSETAFIQLPPGDAKDGKSQALVGLVGDSQALGLANTGWSGWTQQADKTWLGYLTAADGSQTKYIGRGDGAGGHIVDGYTQAPVNHNVDAPPGTENTWQKNPLLTSTDYYDPLAKGYYTSLVNPTPAQVAAGQVDQFQRQGTFNGQNVYQNYNIKYNADGGETYAPAGNSFYFNSATGQYQQSTNIVGNAGSMTPEGSYGSITPAGTYGW